MNSVAGRILWVAAVIAVAVLVWGLVSSWNNAGDAWATLTQARDAIEPFFTRIGEFINGIVESAPGSDT